MKNLQLILAIISIVVVTGCEGGGPETDVSGPKYLKGNGVFVINEGNFTWGNGSLSFYSTDSAKIYNNVFSEVNSRPLGDVPNSMTLYGDNAYIVVNNSGKIEVVSTNTLLSSGTISNLNSPREIKFINSRKAYISSMYSDSVTIMDPETNSISGYINMRRSSESIEIYGNKAFISNWLSGNELMVINTQTNTVIDSIMVGIEPESIAIDKNGKLWVLCTGGYLNKEFPELIRINTTTFQIEKRFVFPERYSFPSNLKINGTKDIIMWLDNGVKKMSITDNELPSTVFIQQKRNYFYKMGIDPVTNEVFVTDAGDYVQNGKLFRYNGGGIVIDSVSTDIIPASLCFKSAND